MSRRATDYEARAAQAWKNPEQVHGSEGENKPVLGLLANGRYALPNIANLNQRAEDEFTPEGITLNNTADTAARQDRPPDG